jgi:hypothetical protein
MVLLVVLQAVLEIYLLPTAEVAVEAITTQLVTVKVLPEAAVEDLLLHHFLAVQVLPVKATTAEQDLVVLITAAAAAAAQVVRAVRALLV